MQQHHHHKHHSKHHAWGRFRRRLKYFYYHFIRDPSPERVLRGISVGVFFGCTPFLGIHMLFAFVTAAVINGNKILAVISTWIMNPLTLVPLFILDYRVGRFLFYPSLSLTVEFSEKNLTSIRSIIGLGWDVFGACSLGGVIVGLILALIFYVMMRPLYHYFRRLHLLERFKKHGR
ncbi:MAG: hypothetical protein A2Z91_00455 [Deltaproteobacteria bacterium GWA2_38_16]|nr:MAG: hypothetical protein A2Z91_00455 [Deltaproteobacteria bacterium GWA2_38_16]OGQ03573.1 MAG: hypothetical protein A3D19_01860 [Deltaproteobacteria bacterium RIFCSPHIGHO2_02_FULL_38_15]OGQ30153.1 MAG: hypothetical protein A3A72_01480 [Deltaproteobacteria bacterium RIFCSPLOWO2_01_FULL_38_9]OGQ64028.1 MAG: hypothetical protein A3G92_01120 [Deltaproteobacteria bacterium RIFCSPLOWO2_12_FULL_38_8]